MKADVIYRFSFCNFSKPDSLYNYGMKPVLYSTIEAEKHYVGWSRVGNNIRYLNDERNYSLLMLPKLNGDIHIKFRIIIILLVSDIIEMSQLAMMMRIVLATHLHLL